MLRVFVRKRADNSLISLDANAISFDSPRIHSAVMQIKPKGMVSGNSRSIELIAKSEQLTSDVVILNAGSIFVFVT